MKSAAADFDAARDAFWERQTTNGATRRCTGGDATKHRAAETAPRPRIGMASTDRCTLQMPLKAPPHSAVSPSRRGAPPRTPGGTSHCCSLKANGAGADGAAERRANNEANRYAADNITSPLAGAGITEGCAHHAVSPKHGGTHDNVTMGKGSDGMSSLERFVHEIEAMQDEAIDAALDVAGSSDEGAVKIVEEACWGSALSADGNVGYHYL